MSLIMKPDSVIEARLGIQANGPVQAFFTNRCYKAMDKYVPKDVGNLRTIVEVSTNKITYKSPYARYQYYGIREDGTHKVQHYTTAGTGTYWDKRMWSADGEKVIKDTQNHLGGK